jgi:hypothetical protein
MQIKTTIIYHLILVRMDTIKNKWKARVLEKIGEIQTLYTVHSNAKECSHWKTAQRFLKKWKLELADNPAEPHLGNYPIELISGSQRDIFLPIFIEYATIQISQNVGKT